MKVTLTDDDHLTIGMDMSTAEKLYEAINKRTVDMTNGAIELASLLQEASYDAAHTFKQPPHAFDKHHPPHPTPED